MTLRQRLPYKRETKRLYASEVVIEAPVQTVWDTFTDLPRLGEWNPLLTAIEGELGLGQRLQVRRRLDAATGRGHGDPLQSAV